MILVLDADNRYFNFAAINESNGNIVKKVSVSSSADRSVDEYVFLVNAMMGGALADLKGAVVSSVNPRENHTIKKIMTSLTGITPSFVGQGMKTGLNLKVDHHEQLGSDIVCCAVGAFARARRESADRGSSLPVIVVDIKYATTVSAVSSLGELCGVAIIPGVSLSVDALSRYSGSLPDISLKAPKLILGRNTYDSMNCGAVLSHAYAVDGFIENISANYFEGEKPVVFVTGESASLVAPLLRGNVKTVSNLCFEGLAKIYDLNK
ncbi:MAG: type III pantothenate kinase [Ruminococcaceae bacterium]|nr:type III pantothenate kinase [Oscillospiraceae bacterium]